MNENKLIEFAYSYSPYKTMRNTKQNKVIVCSLLVLLTSLPLYILKVYIPMVMLIFLSVILFILGIFASKIRCIKILNNISLSIFVGLAFPVCIVCVFANQMGYPLLNFLLFSLILSIASLNGFVYTRKKIKYISKSNKKNQNRPINSVLITLAISCAIALFRKIIQDYFLLVSVIGGYTAMIFFVPKIIASIVQLIIIKKYKLRI